MHQVLKGHMLRQALMNSASNVIDLRKLSENELVACLCLRQHVCVTAWRIVHLSSVLVPYFSARTQRIAPELAVGFPWVRALRFLAKTVRVNGVNKSVPGMNTTKLAVRLKPVHRRVRGDLPVRDGRWKVSAH